MKKRTTAIKIVDFSIKFQDRPLIEEVNLSLPFKERVAIVGRNGSGKTTLLNYLYEKWQKQCREKNSDIETQGEVLFSNNLKIGYFPQSIKITYSGLVKDYLKSGSRTMEILEAYENEEKNIEIINKMNEGNVWKFIKKRDSVFNILGINEWLENPVLKLSGGEAAKVALAKILLSDSNYLFFDEPTNNLDFSSLNFLTNFMKNWDSGAVIISHDRDFLDETVSKIIEIDDLSSRISIYGGNYSFYKNKKEEEEVSQKRKFEAQEKRKKRLETQSKKLFKTAEMFEEESGNSFRRARGAKIAKRAVNQKKRIEVELSEIEKTPKKRLPYVHVPSQVKNMGLLVDIDSLNYKPKGKELLFKDFSFKLYGNEVIAIIGPNGSGKTTLFELILGNIKPESGLIKKRSGLKISYYKQHLENPDITIFDLAKLEGINLKKEDIKRKIGAILFRNTKRGDIDKLSLGEIQKLQLLFALEKNPDLLLLDEPTNHLDLESIEMLENVIKKFNGAVMIISHDRRLLKNINIKKVLDFRNKKIFSVNSKEDIDKIFY